VHVQGELIDILRNRMVLASPLGARILPGLVGTITWPRVKSDPTVQWMGVNPASAASDSAAAYGWVNSTAKTMIGTVPFPRQLLSASGIDIENDVRMRLGAGHGLALDLAGIKGLGTDKEPLGILNNPDAQTYDIGTSGSPAVPTYTKLKRMTGMVSEKNVLGGSMGWLTTPLMAAELGATQIATNMPRFIWEGTNEDGIVAGYKAAASSQSPKNLYTSTTDHTLVFGAWEHLIFGLWGALEVLVDPYTLATYGQIRVTTYQQGDVVCQRPEAFVLGRYAKISA
jgi:HK97 family phage major capsid protein